VAPVRTFFTSPVKANKSFEGNQETNLQMPILVAKEKRFFSRKKNKKSFYLFSVS